MSTYRVETDKGTYEVETDDSSSGPQWSDIPANALEGLKEAPQTALGMANMVATGQDLTDPASYVKSGVQALTGTPLADTDTGKAIGTVGKSIGNSIQSARDFADSPGKFIKNEIIQHPIGTAANVAGLAMGLGAGEGALDTMGEYAGRFGGDQAVKALGRMPAGMDVDTARTLGRKANDMGLLDATMGPIGRKETVDAMVDQSGRDLGEIRADASSVGPARTGQQMADAIREKLGPDYQPGGKNFDQAQALERELQNIQQMPSTTPADYAARASEMYQKAKGKGFAVPTNVDTDVAGSLAHLNDEDIATRLPNQAAQYDSLKSTFGDTSDMQEMIGRGERRSVNRPGSHTFLEAGGKFLDEIGAHKVGAHVGFGAESALNGASAAVRPAGVAAITSNIMSRIQTNPQSLGKFAAPLMQAAQGGGSQGIAAMHYVLSSQYPEEYPQTVSDQK